MAKAKKKSKAKKAKPAKKKAKKAAKRVAAKARKAPAKKAKAKKAAKAKKPARKAAPKKKKQNIGEGDYAASKKFLKDQSDFVKRNKARIPEMGKQAERALEGPEGESLRAAEQEAMSRSTIE